MDAASSRLYGGAKDFPSGVRLHREFAEIAAKSAKSDGIENVALIVTIPFVFEGSGKLAKATEALKSLSGLPVKVLNNEELTECYPDINFINAFEYSDKEALNAMESGLI